MAVLAKDEYCCTRRYTGTELVSVPELGEGKLVRIGAWSVGVRDEWELFVFNASKEGDDAISGEDVLAGKYLLLTLSIVDDDGKQIFTMDDLAPLKALPVSVFDRILDSVQLLNGIDLTREDAAKNSQETTGSNSSTDLQDISSAPSSG